ncbi:WD40 repeat domain-containing protein, partial [Aspergillus fijiensis CBS 313.89]
RLKIAPEAGIGAEKNDTKDKCFAGTQIGILKKIHGWIQSPGPEHIFWLYGVAGGGKSTISRTIAERCRDRIFLPETICLGASFFFDKNERQQSNATYLFPTLCQSLANCLPELKSEIRKSLEEHPESSNEHASVRMQWKNLILKPLLSLEKNNHLLPLTLIVVIDALDECQSTHNEDPVYAILELINEAHQLRSIRLKFLLTSRPQSHIFSSFDHVVTGSHGCKQALQGAETPIDQEMSHRDIKMVLKHKLGEISQRHHFGSEWPEEEKLDALFKKADGLWIYASTAWGFICDKKAKKEWIKPRLDLLLTNDRHPRERLDGMYTEVLRDVLSFATPEERIGTRRTFQAIFGAIVVLHRPLSVTTLSNLLSKNTAEVRGMLESLSSVIHVAASNDSPIRLAHLSFPEFLTSKERCLEPTFQISRKEKHSHLLRHCLEALTKTLRQDICHLGDSSTLQDSIDPGIVKQEIPSHVEYACVYWVEHLRLSKSSDLPPTMRKVWSPLLQTLKGYGGRGIDFSPDGKLFLATLSESGKVQLWSTATGTLIHSFDCCIEDPRDLYIWFSPGGQSFAANCVDGAVHIHNTQTGARVHSLTREKYRNWPVTFSPDSNLCACAVYSTESPGESNIHLIKVWGSNTGELRPPLKGHGKRVCCLSFSPDGEFLAGATLFEKCVLIWNLAS